MELKVSSDEDEIFLFEHVVRHLQSSYGYSYDGAVSLVNRYYEKFTDINYCKKHGIPVQNEIFFSHIAALGMADRVHYYEGLNNAPNETAFVSWQKAFRK